MRLKFTILIFIVATSLIVYSDDFYVYWEFEPNINYTSGVGGFIDEEGVLGPPGGQYIIVAGSPMYCGAVFAYIYRVEVNGDPQRHPENPDDPGPVAERTFTLISQHYIGYFCAGSENAFVCKNDGIYYGASDGLGGILKWNWSWGNQLNFAPPCPGESQTLGYDVRNGYFWAGTTDRRIYRYNGQQWEYVFTYPDLGGFHHDGLEVVNGLLYLSDMSTNHIIVYHLDENGNLIEPPNNPYQHIYFTGGTYVEGMGYGPNQHFWVATWNGKSILEIGGGSLMVPTVTPTPTPMVVPTLNSINLLILILVINLLIFINYLKRRGEL